MEKETKESKPKTEEKIATDKPRKLSYKEQRELEEINASLPFLEEQKEKLANQLSTPDLTYEEITRISNELEKIIQEIDEKEMRWLELN